MKKGIAFTIGALYSLFLSIMYHISKFILQDIEHGVKLSFLLTVFIPIILLSIYLCTERKSFFIGTIIGLYPLVIVLKLDIILTEFLVLFFVVSPFLGIDYSAIDEIKLIFDQISDFTSYTFDYILSLIFVLLIINFAYQVNVTKKPLKDTLFAIGYCMLCVGGTFIINALLQQFKDIYFAQLMLLFLNFSLPITLYIIAIIFSKNKILYRTLILLFWIFYAPSIFNQIILCLEWTSFEHLFSNYFIYITIFVVLLTSAIEHLVAFIIYICKKTSEAPLINQNIMITNYPPKV